MLVYVKGSSFGFLYGLYEPFVNQVKRSVQEVSA